MSNNTPAKVNPFYEIDRIKEIPIADLCRNVLGLECSRRGDRTWCKLRPERTASTLLNENRNTYYDFGTTEHGDIINLVSSVMHIDYKAAIQFLGETYGIPAADRRQGLSSHELTSWEYAKLGIYADLATKNFEFNTDRMPYERICEISEKYSIPMNELRKKHPKIYERIIRQKALSHVRGLRNEYYLDLWNQYQTATHMGNPSLFFTPETFAYFDDQLKALREAERILSKAVQGTQIHLRPMGEYEPAKDLELISDGKVKPTLGPAGYQEMQDAAKLADSTVHYRTVDYDRYVQHMMQPAEELLYSAFLRSGRVVIGYLTADYDRFKPYFDQMGLSQTHEPIQKENRPANSSTAINSSSPFTQER